MAAAKDVAGANGIGKTSLLRMLCGLAPIEQGDILWQGQSLTRQRSAFLQDMCFQGHLHGLQEAMTVQENIHYACALRGYAPPRARLMAMLERFGLAGRAHQAVRSLSQGQKRRTALSRLALCPARLWVLDEPFVAMDDKGIAMLTDLIAEHLNQGGLTVLTSHQAVTIGHVAAQTLQLAP